MFPLLFYVIGGDYADPQTERLKHGVKRLKKKGWASSTSETYKTHLQTFLSFCKAHKLASVPADIETVEMYVAYLVDVKKFKFSSIKSYLNIISVLHKSENLPDPTTTWHVKHVLTGVKREVTPRLLLEIHDILDFTCKDNCGFWAACLVGFFGFLRPNNFLVKGVFDPSRHVQCLDLLSHPWGMLLSLKVVKTMQFRAVPIEIVLPRLQQGHPLCPCAPLQQLLVRPDLTQPLFLLSSGKCLSYSGFLKAFRLVLSQLGYYAASYGGHSLRRGAATWASSCGVADDDIQLLGLWSSDCYKRYIETDRSKRINAMNLFCLPLPR
ncbi:uncharacterized protein [Argopecten irradians]|uniref:uncharacterized protein n=1 Tax=Argopecten irradians TaxID=31199 RepID=UPI0037131B1B